MDSYDAVGFGLALMSGGMGLCLVSAALWGLRLLWERTFHGDNQDGGAK